MFRSYDDWKLATPPEYDEQPLEEDEPVEPDEFEITATHPNMDARVWTRSTYDTAKFIADSAITKLGYVRAVVINTYGGDKSDTLYEVTGSHSKLVSTKDHVAEERHASHQKV